MNKFEKLGAFCLFMVLAMLLMFISGCSKYEPVIDLKASGDNASEAQIDEMQCEWMAERYDLDDEETKRKCLTGRGHSVLN
jgi:hypothetical protein